MEQDLPNPMERGYSLPPGCKDLIDALKRAGEEGGDICESGIAAMNEQITAEYVRVFWPNKTEIGVFKLKDAIALAKSMKMDLIEDVKIGQSGVSKSAPSLTPPICFLFDLAALMRGGSKGPKKE